MNQLAAATKSVLQFEGKALACPFSKLTANELLEYILGYYEVCTQASSASSTR